MIAGSVDFVGKASQMEHKEAEHSLQTEAVHLEEAGIAGEKRLVGMEVVAIFGIVEYASAVGIEVGIVGSFAES
jgi:hypothetical protein